MHSAGNQGSAGPPRTLIRTPDRRCYRQLPPRRRRRFSPRGWARFDVLSCSVYKRPPIADHAAAMEFLHKLKDLLLHLGDDAAWQAMIQYIGLGKLYAVLALIVFAGTGL